MEGWKILSLFDHNSRGPEFFLGLEELFLHSSESPLLILYENKPCVVIGKNQNPWQELEINYLEQNNIPWFRRISGGGTVFHGQGNLLYCFIEKTENGHLISMKKYNQVLQKALESMGFRIEEDHRHCLFFQGKKISGNAQAKKKDVCMSHGTLLVNADLKLLSGCLKKDDSEFISKAVKSVKNEVGNLLPESAPSRHRLDFYQQFESHLVNELNAETVSLENMSIKPEEMFRYASKFLGWDWNFGKTPAFTLSLQNIIPSGPKGTIFVSGGKFERTEIDGNSHYSEMELKFNSPELTRYLHTLSQKILA